MQINSNSRISFTNGSGKRSTLKIGDIWALKGTKAVTICHGTHNGNTVNSPAKVDLSSLGHKDTVAIFADDSMTDQIPAIMSVSAFATLSTVGVTKYGKATIKA